MRTLLLIALAALILGACTRTQVPPTQPASYYFKEGEDLYERGLYEDAVASWEKVRDSYYSPELNILAEMKIGEAYYLAEMFVEAAATYEDFLKNHPDNPNTPHVMYMLGMSYYNQILAPNKDQTAANSALITFRNLLKVYPGIKQAEDVKGYIQVCLNQLAWQEYLIGEFYMRTGHPQAAARRFEQVIEKYPNFAGRAELYYALGRSYLELKQKRKAVEAFNVLYRDFPYSKFVDKAQKALGKYY